jgi:hypothetical protein
MPKVVVIGDGLGNYADSLSSTGYSTLRFKSAKPALGKINGSSLIVIDGRHAEALGELSKASRHIPKLVVVSPEKPAKSLGRWLRTPLSYPICRPSERELLSFAARILRERDSCNEKERLTGELGVLRKEIEFFEEINRMLTSSQDLNKTLVTIMKRLREVTRAEAWSIYLVDDLTGASRGWESNQ